MIGPFIKIKKTSAVRFNSNNIEGFKRIFSVIYNDLLIHNSLPHGQKFMDYSIDSDGETESLFI
jgi:hypothetical protein